MRRAALEPLLLLTAGGTIDKVYFDAQSDYEVGTSVIPDLLNEANVRAPFTHIPVMRKDSLEMTAADRQLIHDTLAGRAEKRCVITHGTDTMTDTAAALEDLTDRIVVLTGSMAPARFAHTDATFNVGMAFAAVQTLGPGVYIAMNGLIFLARNVVKDRQLRAFVPRSNDG